MVMLWISAPNMPHFSSQFAPLVLLAGSEAQVEQFDFALAFTEKL